MHTLTRPDASVDTTPLPAQREHANPRAAAPRHRTQGAGSVKPRYFRQALHYGGNVFTWMLLSLAVVAFIFLAVGPRVFGYQTYTMLTSSMSPGIQPGDVVVTDPTLVGEIEVGDIITYHIPVQDHRVETHRIVEISRDPDGATAVRTKGDANDSADPWTAVLEGEHVDRHAFTIPNLGTAIRILRQPAVMNTLMYAAPVVLVVGALVLIWRRDDHGQSEGTDAMMADGRRRLQSND